MQCHTLEEDIHVHYYNASSMLGIPFATIEDTCCSYMLLTHISSTWSQLMISRICKKALLVPHNSRFHRKRRAPLLHQPWQRFCLTGAQMSSYWFVNWRLLLHVLWIPYYFWYNLNMSCPCSILPRNHVEGMGSTAAYTIPNVHYLKTFMFVDFQVWEIFLHKQR